MKKKALALRFDLPATYLAAVEGSVGTRMFRRLYLRRGKRRVDVTDDGRVSCAYFVSGLLKMFGLLAEAHATVDGTLRDMGTSGWKKVREPRPGAILLWEPANHGGTVNRHLGFSVGGGEAVSNSTRYRAVRRHHWTFGESGGVPKRRVEAIYWHPRLGK